MVYKFLIYNILTTKLIAITDIHGEYDKLCNLLNKLKLTGNDKIVFMGDYIDRGERSKDVVDKVISMSSICDCEYLIGSHEYALLHSTEDDYFNYLFWNYGGDATVRSYSSFDNILKIHGEFFNSLKPYYIFGKYLFVHAGLKIGVPLEEQNLVDMVYIRSAFYNHKHNFNYKIIFGHTEFDKPQIWEDKICIDTGCGKYKNAPLTAFVCENGKEYFINSND